MMSRMDVCPTERVRIEGIVYRQENTLYSSSMKAAAPF